MAWVAIDFKSVVPFVYKDKPKRIDLFCDGFLNKWDGELIGFFYQRRCRKKFGRELTWNDEPIEIDAGECDLLENKYFPL